MPYGLPAEALDRLVHLLREDPRIHKAWLYGSRALGTEKSASDIDLSLEAPSLAFSDLAAIEMRIDDLLLPWKVDLSLMHQLDDPSLLANIRRTGIDLLSRGACATQNRKDKAKNNSPCQEE